MADDKPIIVIKKKGGHGGHHGGAWKVAYADFVTAMMAFFMVMWLVNSSSQADKMLIGSYFRNPGIFIKGSGAPLETGGSGIMFDGFLPAQPDNTMRQRGGSRERLPGKSGMQDEEDLQGRVTVFGEAGKVGNKKGPEEGIGTVREQGKDGGQNFGHAAMTDDDDPIHGGYEKEKTIPTAQDTALKGKTREMIDEAAEKLKNELLNAPELKELLGIVDVKVDADGLNLEIMDTDKTSMFGRGSARVLAPAEAAFAKITSVIKNLPNTVDIVGHTDSKPFAPGGYSNWELSADRANAARRLLEGAGFDPQRIKSVVGRADKELKVIDNPAADANRRITLKLRFNLNLMPTQSPAELQNLQLRERQFQDSQEKSRETVHSFTTQEIIQGRRPRDESRRRVPEENVTGLNPDAAPRNRTFKENPVIGPADPFSMLN